MSGALILSVPAVPAGGPGPFLFDSWVEEFVRENAFFMTGAGRRGDIPVFPRLQRIENLLTTMASRFSSVVCLTSCGIAAMRLIPASSVK